jgi:hypothetical protein
MKTVSQCLAVLCCGVTAHAAQQLVVPGGLANVEGNSSGSGPFLTAGATFQQVYSASEFAALSAPTGIITGVSFRLDSAAGQRLLGSWPSLTISLATTSQSPDALSPNMADNAGPATIVFGSSLFFNTTYVPGVDPQQFDIRIRFSQPFFYAPSQGNISMAMFGVGGQQIVSLDAESTVGDGIGSVFANGSTLIGTPSTLGLITRFDIAPIPEPSSAIIVLMAVLVSLAIARVRATANHVK